MNEENDEDTRTFEITPLPQPDLVVTSVTSSDTYASGGAGGISVGFTLKNEGDAEAYGSMAYVLICHETEGINDAVLIGEKPVDALGPGVESGSYTVSCTYTAAANGNYKVYVKADGLGTVTESNESNNAGKFDITFIHGVGAADLVVSIVYLSPAYDFSNPIDTIDVVYSVYNVGTGSSGPSWVGIVLTDQVGGQAQTWGPSPVPQLDSYGSYMDTQSLVPLPVAPVGGTPYVLTLTADLQEDVAESNEANNTTSGTVLMY